MHSFYENLDRLYKSDVLLVDSRINKYVFRVLQLFIIKSHKYKNAYKILRIILTYFTISAKFPLAAVYACDYSSAVVSINA